MGNLYVWRGNISGVKEWLCDGYLMLKATSVDKKYSAALRKRDKFADKSATGRQMDELFERTQKNAVNQASPTLSLRRNNLPWHRIGPCAVDPGYVAIIETAIEQPRYRTGPGYDDPILVLDGDVPVGVVMGMRP